MFWKLTLLIPVVAFVLIVSPATAKPWNSEFPVNHPEFCYSQILRVNKVASFLMKYIYDRSVGHTETGYFPSKQVSIWKLKIVQIEEKAHNELQKISGRACGILGNRSVKELGDFWRKIKKEASRIEGRLEN
tara:strand:+ start:175 stop:570 length:396 start_codon:yes stop_codon:yes gene_type:complete